MIADLTRKRSSRFKREVKKLLGGDSADTSLVDGIVALARETVPLPHRSIAELPRNDLQARDIARIVERLVALGLCSRGFSVDCAECQMESYVEHSAVSPQATCPGCGAAGAYREDGDKPAGPVVRYRLNSLLDRASDNGAPPHILGMACLREHAAGRPLYVLPGALLRDGNAELGEVDLLGYLGEQVIAGEVKTSPADFTKDQVTKDLSLAARAGANVYVMIAVHQLTAAQEGMATRLAAAQGCQLLTFSGSTAHPAGAS